MPENVSNPLLSLIKERQLLDDLQYEEVVAEQSRSGKPISQILQDSGMMDLDTQLQVIADHWLWDDVAHVVAGKEQKIRFAQTLFEWLKST